MRRKKTNVAHRDDCTRRKTTIIKLRWQDQHKNMPLNPCLVCNRRHKKNHDNSHYTCEPDKQEAFQIQLYT